MEPITLSLTSLLLWSAVALVAFVIVLFLVDADLTLFCCEKFWSHKLSKYHGQVVWVTGASTGIGAAMAIDAASNGAKIVITARSEDKLKDVKQKCIVAGSKHGMAEKDVLVLPLDLCKFDLLQSAVEQVMKHFGQLDVVLLNAGRSQRARWEHTSLDVDKELFDLNVFSAVALARLVIPIFEKNTNGGSFGIVSSVAAKAGPPFSGTYSGTKFALHGYFESLRAEKLGSGINITMLCMGPVFSNLLAIAATEKGGETYSGAMSSTDRRMTAERCARLCLLAVANGLEEAWMALPPVLPLIYVVVYMPVISKRLLGIVGKSGIQKLRDSKETVKQD